MAHRKGFNDEMKLRILMTCTDFSEHCVVFAFAIPGVFSGLNDQARRDLKMIARKHVVYLLDN